jgi:hypothetical protein
LAYLRSTKRQPEAMLAQNRTAPPADPARRVVVRLTVPPVQPLQDTPMPIIRAQSPDPAPGDPAGALLRPGFGNDGRSLGDRPGYLPNYETNPTRPTAPPPTMQSPMPRDSWQPPGARLGMPQFATPAMVSGRANPLPASPVGYPN